MCVCVCIHALVIPETPWHGLSSNPKTTNSAKHIEHRKWDGTEG